jgi:hypothetical protein
MEPRPKALVVSSLSDSAVAPVVAHRALEQAGYDVIRYEELPPGALLTNAILDAIRGSELILADISEPNPNVYYELGYAHALGKQTVLLIRSDAQQSIPFDVAGLRIFVYEQDSPRSIKRLVNYLATLRERQSERRIIRLDSPSQTVTSDDQ